MIGDPITRAAQADPPIHEMIAPVYPTRAHASGPFQSAQSQGTCVPASSVTTTAFLPGNPCDEESGRRDSNSRHSRWQRDALPTELRPRFRGRKVGDAPADVQGFFSTSENGRMRAAVISPAIARERHARQKKQTARCGPYRYSRIFVSNSCISFTFSGFSVARFFVSPRSVARSKSCTPPASALAFFFPPP